MIAPSKAPDASFRPFANERIAVLGLGRNGMPAARALIRYGAEVAVWDDQHPARQAALAEGMTLLEPAADLVGFDAMVVSPGIPHLLPKPHKLAARAHIAGVPILSDADYLFRAVRAAGSRARFVGITGTNGKSTTTALFAHIAATAGRPVQAGGNLGIPALGLNILGSEGVYALEMSSYMLERLASIRFDAAAMLNLTPDHLERHGDLAGYRAAKARIFCRQDESCQAIVCVDDQNGVTLAETLATRPARLVRISGADRRAEVSVVAGRIVARDGRIASLVGHAALPGTHNAQNAAAAAALALAVGIEADAIGAGIATFPGLAHRQERIAEIAGVRFVNDSKATNADSTARALDGAERIFWIAGGVAKEGGIEPLRPLLGAVSQAFLIGEAAPVFAATLASAGIAHVIAGTLEQAVAGAFAAARAASPATVLLSPAAASFDQFANFEARGEAFRALVGAIAGREAA